MPKEINYIACDCEGGKLHEIAQIAVGAGPSFDPDTWQVTYYACDSCGTIFGRKTIKRYSEELDDYEPEEVSDFKQYKGKLTLEEIARFAKTCHGDINDYVEEEIIKRRTNPEVEVPLDCECKAGKLEELASTAIAKIKNGMDKMYAPEGVFVDYLNTIFYQCDSCNKIFDRIHYYGGPKKNPKLEEVGGLIKYEGSLRKEEIISEVPKIQGFMDEIDEGNIIRTRRKSK